MTTNIKKFYRKREIFISWFISYFFIVAISLFFYMIAYQQAIKVLTDISRENQESTINRLKLLIDNNIKNIDGLMDFITLDANIKWLVNSGINTETDQHVSDIENNIYNLSKSNPIINKIYIYAIYNDNNSKIFPRDYRSTKIDWQKFLNTKDVNNFNKYRNVIYKDIDENLFLIKPFPFLSPSVKDAYAITLLNSTILLEEINELENKKSGSVIILDDDNDIILTSSNSINGNFNILKILENMKIGDNNNFITQNALSAFSNMKYISIIPANIYKDRIKYLKNLLYMMVFLFVCIAITASYYFSKKNYNPLLQIMNLLKGENYNFDSKKFQKYNSIFKQINNIIVENKTNFDKLQNQHNIIKTFYLSNLISGKIDTEQDEIYKDLDTYDIVFLGGKFTVLLFHLNNNSQINLIFYSILSNIAEKLKNDERLFYVTEINGSYVLLFNFSHKLADEEILLYLKKDIKQIQEKLKDANFEFSILSGSVKTGIMEIKHSYEEARACIDYEILKGFGQILFFSEITEILDSKDVKYFSSQNMSEKLFNLIRAGLFDAAKELIQIEIETIVNIKSVSIDTKKTKLSSLKTIILNSLEEIPLVFRERLKENGEMIDSFIKCKTFPELQMQSDKIFLQLTSYSRNKRNRRSSLSENAINYIKKNFQDINLSINAIADEFDISVQHLSISFKKQTGTGILIYLHKLRREKAKDLLANSKYNVKEIAQKVGYYTDIGFIRAFKRYEGVTPGQYRDMIEKGGIQK